MVFGVGVPRSRWPLIVAVVVMFLVPGLPARASTTWCPEGVTSKQGIGRVCEMPNGLLQLEIDRGTGRFTHGADPYLDAVSGDGTDATAGAPASDPFCVTDPSEHRVQVTYAHPTGSGDLATRAPQLRELVRSANGRLQQELAEFGATGAYRVACDGTNITVVDAALSIGTITDFSGVVAALSSRGGTYTNPKVKHWVWYEGRTASSGVSGTGHIYDDDDLELENRNNGSPNSISTYAVQWGHCCGSSSSTGFFGVGTWMHELGHNLGAVQGGGNGTVAAPNSTEFSHCNDGLDIMCYADGSPNSAYSSSVCTDRAHFDCNHDDYFNPSPAAGTYLATHWNLASCFNRYLHLSYCQPATPPVLSLSTANVSVPEGDGAARITVLRSGSTAAAVSATISTADGSATAGTDYTATTSTVTVPAGAASAVLQIPIVQDTLDEADETFTATLSQPSGATATAPTTQTVTILDDDTVTDPTPPPTPAPSTVTFLMSAMEALENAGTLSIPANRSGPTLDALSIPIARSGDAGTSDAITDDVLLFPAGSATGTLLVAITDDASPEASEAIVLSMTPLPNAPGIGAIGAMTVTIAASDVQPDALISTADGTIRGDGIINATGVQQTVGANARTGQAMVTRTVRIEHDAPAAMELLLRRNATPAGTAVRVLLNGADVTSALLDSLPVTIAAGQRAVLQVSMRFTRVLADGALRRVSITAKRSSDGLRLDTVRSQLRYLR